MTITDNGWDSRAWLEGDWLHREPRRDEVRPKLLAETRLLPWLAPQLPLPVPLPEPTEYGVRHRLLVGEPLEEATIELGHALGSFLRALHDVDPVEAVARGAQDAESAAAERVEILDKMRAQVIPLLPASAQADGEELIDRIAGVHTTLVHGDLGPEHVRVHEGRITGVIDWTDAHIGDPGLDLAWCLIDPAIAEGVAEAYGVTAELRERAYDWHRLGPWYEVGYGIETEQPEFVQSGLTGVLKRL
ncbi:MULTISPECIES: phosphotransferase [unclassified Kribbella]|uniref:phosphotransferase n=1 Tax=unclassified Kribbella TaxID=2644121 RepID=UPI003016F93E